MEIGVSVGIAFGAFIVLLIISYFTYRKCRRANQISTRLTFGDYVRSITLQEKERAVSLAVLASSSPRLHQLEDAHEELLLSPAAQAAAATPSARDDEMDHHHHQQQQSYADEEEEQLSFASLSRQNQHPPPRNIL